MANSAAEEIDEIKADINRIEAEIHGKQIDLAHAKRRLWRAEAVARRMTPAADGRFERGEG